MKPYRWVMLALLWLLYITFGLVSRSIFPLVTPILADLELSYSQMGLILGSWQLTYIFAALVAGTILDRWGVRKSIFAGVMVIGLSASLRYFSDDFISMLTAVALFGLGGPMISIGGPKTISAWFHGRSRGTAMGIYTTGNWAGGLMALALTNSLVMPLVGNNWRLVFVVYGVTTFLIALQWFLLARGDGSVEQAERSRILVVFSSLIKIRNVRILLVMGLLSFAISHGFSSWLPKILEDSGMSAAQAGWAAAISIAAGIPSILILPTVVPPRFRGRIIAVFAMLTTINLILVMKISGTALYLGLATLGFISAPFMALLLLILMDSPGVETRHMGSAGGMFFCVSEIGGFTGPFIMGILVDATGTFMTGALFLAGLCMALAALTIFLNFRPPSTFYQSSSSSHAS
jgi:CP family cyanate transporter-like MFS transporter